MRAVPVILALVLAVAVAGFVAGVLRSAERAITLGPAPAGAQTPPADAPPPALRVGELLKTLRLVTVQLDTTVSAQSADDSWRGRIEARVTAPARLHFGVDLAHPDARVVVDPLTGGLTLAVPEPTLLAAEITGPAAPVVDVGWARLRDRGGEFHAGQARDKLHDAARRTPLSPVDAERVAAGARDQLVALARLFAGGTIPVRVEFFRIEKTAP
jgi:hypothetical protein